MKITNRADISLPLAVWLVHDEYDYNPDERYISATALMRPVRQTVLARRIESADREMDVADLLASSLGTAVHDSIENAWKRGGKNALKRLGYPAKVYENLAINPTPEEIKANPNIVACYIEQRTIREIDGWKIGGKFDMILDGRLYDHKTTSVYAYLSGSKDDDYAMQGGLYRWLNPNLVIDDHIYINFIFTDWQKAMTAQREDYPKLRAMEYPVRMLETHEVESWARAKLRELQRCWDLPQDELPRCTDKELWRSDPQFKYYSDPAKANMPGARSTKNFSSRAEANAHLSACGKGVIKEIPGEVKACNYCPAFEICKQKDEYFQ